MRFYCLLVHSEGISVHNLPLYKAAQGSVRYIFVQHCAFLREKSEKILKTINIVI